jgi:hypothetical protein
LSEVIDPALRLRPPHKRRPKPKHFSAYFFGFRRGGLFFFMELKNILVCRGSFAANSLL